MRNESDDDEADPRDPLRRQSLDDSANVRVEPLVDPFTGVKIFNIASHNLYDANILARNVQAGH